MVSYLLQRLAYMVVLLLMLSVAAFVIIELPTGDALSTQLAGLAMTGSPDAEQQIEAMRLFYGLDRPGHERYFVWMGNLLRGDLGNSFHHMVPNTKLIGERLPGTVIISVTTLFFTYVVGIGIGIYSATHQYSFGDYSAAVFGFVGMATPNFILALVLLYLAYVWFGESLLGLFSRKYADAPWSLAKAWDLMKHLPVPIIVIGTAGTAGLIRTLRATLLDELGKQYVITARAKGLQERRLTFKYPVRVALNPIISGLGGVFAAIVSGEAITSIVLSLPTTGSLLLVALTSQDTYLAGSIVMVLSALTILGFLVSDLTLAAVDPRIRLERGQ